MVKQYFLFVQKLLLHNLLNFFLVFAIVVDQVGDVIRDDLLKFVFVLEFILATTAAVVRQVHRIAPDVDLDIFKEF